ncbi:hypothetical protein [Parvibaculum sp.]|uniref:hypothetical protein n=1 Tax=Parvibaculum sp. TaxID=2024848 RepID=UPI001D5392C3|nr:hypothetical protein [Parvibaculum sp.]MBX3490881.1 hypothetical protein [Parvibaculum sp.]
MKLVSLVKQHSPHSCGMAALAMILGLQHSADVASVIQRSTEDKTDDPEVEYIGVIEQELSLCLFERGISNYLWWNIGSCFPEDSWLRRHGAALYWPTEADMLQTIRTEIAVLGVPSINIRGAGHWLVVADGEVFDPSTKKTYRQIDEIETVQQAVLVDRASLAAYREKTA